MSYSMMLSPMQGGSEVPSALNNGMIMPDSQVSKLLGASRNLQNF